MSPAGLDLAAVKNAPLVAMETSVYSSVAVTMVLHVTLLPASARALQAGLASHVTSRVPQACMVQGVNYTVTATTVPSVTPPPVTVCVLPAGVDTTVT